MLVIETLTATCDFPVLATWTVVLSIDELHATGSNCSTGLIGTVCFSIFDSAYLTATNVATIASTTMSKMVSNRRWKDERAGFVRLRGAGRADTGLFVACRP